MEYTQDVGKVNLLGYSSHTNYEVINVGTSAVSLTKSVYGLAKRATIRVTNANIRILITGDTPTKSLGMSVDAGSIIELTLHNEIVNFQAISKTNTAAIISVIYYI